MNSYEIFYNTITIKWHFFNEVSYMNTGEKYSVVLEEDAKHLREKKNVLLFNGTFKLILLKLKSLLAKLEGRSWEREEGGREEGKSLMGEFVSKICIVKWRSLALK